MSKTAHELRMIAAQQHQEIFLDLDHKLSMAANKGNYHTEIFVPIEQWDMIIAYCTEMELSCRSYSSDDTVHIIINFCSLPSNTIIQ